MPPDGAVGSARGPDHLSPRRARSTASVEAALLLLLAAACWWPSLSLWFPAPDTLALIETSRFSDLAGFGELWTSRLMEGTGFGPEYYRPVAALSYALDYLVWGLDPFGYQLTNLVLHVALALLVAHTVSLAATAIRGTESSGRGWRMRVGPLAAGLFLLLHPLAAEVVPVPARRQDLLAVLFLTATVVLAGGFFAGPEPGSRKTMFGAWGCWGLALASKEIAVIGAPMLALIAWWAHDRAPWRRRRRLFVLAIAGFSTVLFSYLAVRTAVVGGLGGERAGWLGSGASVDAALGYMASWAHPLGFLIGRVPDALALSAGLVLAALGALIWVRLRRDPGGRRVPGTPVLAIGLILAGTVLVAGPFVRRVLAQAFRVGAGQGAEAELRRTLLAGGHLTVFDWKWGVAVAATIVFGVVGAVALQAWRRTAVAGIWKGVALVMLVAPAGIYAVGQTFSPWGGYVSLVPLSAGLGCLLLPSGGSEGSNGNRETGIGRLVSLPRGVFAVLCVALLGLSPALHGLDALSTTSRITHRTLTEIRGNVGTGHPSEISVFGVPNPHPAFLGRPGVSQLSRPLTDYTVRAYLSLAGDEGRRRPPAVHLKGPIPVTDPVHLPVSEIEARSPEPGVVLLCWPGVERFLRGAHRCPASGAEEQ